MSNRNTLVAIVVIVVLVLIGLILFFSPNPSNESGGEAQHSLSQ